MPKSTVKEEDPYPIPLDTLVPLRLEKVEFVSIDYIVKSGPNAGKPGKFNKWEWTFGVYEGEYTGLTVRGNSEPRITSLEERTGSLHLARPWVEALLGRELALGEEIDTDDLIGLAGVGTVEHLPPRPKKEGGGSWFNVALDELFPAGSMGQAAPARDPWATAGAVPVGAGLSADEPPF